MNRIKFLISFFLMFFGLMCIYLGDIEYMENKKKKSNYGIVAFTKALGAGGMLIIFSMLVLFEYLDWMLFVPEFVEEWITQD